MTIYICFFCGDFGEYGRYGPIFFDEQKAKEKVEELNKSDALYGEWIVEEAMVE